MPVVAVMAMIARRLGHGNSSILAPTGPRLPAPHGRATAAAAMVTPRKDRATGAKSDRSRGITTSSIPIFSTHIAAAPSAGASADSPRLTASQPRKGRASGQNRLNTTRTLTAGASSTRLSPSAGNDLIILQTPDHPRKRRWPPRHLSSGHRPMNEVQPLQDGYRITATGLLQPLVAVIPTCRYP